MHDYFMNGKKHFIPKSFYKDLGIPDKIQF